LKSNSSKAGAVLFADENDTNVGRIMYDHLTNEMSFRTNDVDRVYIDSSGNMGVGVATPAAQLDIASTSKFGGAMDVNSTLDVSSTATVNALNVTLNADIDGTLDVALGANLQSTLVVAGTADFNSSADFEGAVVMQSTLETQGTATLNAVNVSGNADVDGTLDVALGTNLQSTLVVGGAVDINAAMDVSGVAQLASVNVSGNADVDGTMNVQGVATLQNNLVVDTDTLFVNATTDRVGINNAAPATTLHLTGTDAIVIPVGTNAQRVDVTGAIRYNTDNSTFEGYKGTWGSLGGVVDVDQDTKITAEDSAGADNDQLRFYTAGVERMALNANGSLDIMGASDQVGAANLQSTLTVGGAVDINAVMDVQGAATFQDDLVVDTDKFVVDQSTGLVGIGRAAPTFDLDIYKASGDTAIQIQSGNQAAVLRLKAHSSSGSYLNFTDQDDGNVGQVAYTHTDNKMIFRTNDVNRVYIDNAGNMGVGVVAPAAQLDIASTSKFGGAMDVNSSLDVSSTATVNALNVTLNADIDGTLDVALGANLQSTLVVAGTADFNSSADFEGAVVMQSTLKVDGNMESLSQGFNVKDYSGVARLSLGTTDAESSIHIRQANANVVLQNSSATGTAELKFKNAANASTLQVGYDADNSVAYISEQNGNPLLLKINDVEKVRLDGSGNLGVGKTAIAGNKIGVAGNVNIDAGNAYKVNNAIVLNATKLGDAVFNSSLKVVGELTSLSVSGATTLKDTVDVTGQLTVTGAIDANSTLDVASTATLNALVVTGDADLNGALDVAATATVNALNVTNNADIDGTLNVSLASTLQSTLDVQGTATVNALNVSVDAAITGDLVVDTDTLFVDASTDKVGINNATPAYELDVIGSGKFSANLIVDGNLTVQGTTTSINTEVVTIEDPLISLGANNTADLVDTGFYAKYNDGTDKWTGLFRDASGAGEYSLFTGSQTEPTTVVDKAATGYGLAILNIDELKATTVNASTELIGAALKVTGNADLDGTLNVELATTLQSTLLVEATATVNALNVTNNVDIDGTLDVAATAQLNALNVTGNTDIDGTLNVALLSTLDSLLVTNNATVSGDFLVSLNTTLAGGLRVDTDTLVVDATNNKVGINITNPDNELDVNGVIQARNDMVVQGNLIIKGTNASSGDLNAVWAENIYGEAYLLKSAIGIGNTNPQYDVDVSGDINLTGDLYQNGAIVSLAGNVFQTNGTNAYYNAGNIGIGTNAPTNGKLEIVGDYGSVGLSGNAYNDLQADQIGLGSAGTFSYSVYAGGKIAGSSFHAVSDRRVKNIVDQRNNNDDKLAIESLNIYNYTYIDQPNYGNQVKIGVMAQDVEEIHSGIIEEQQKFIPNIYKECQLASVNEVKVNNADVVVGDLIKIQYAIDDKFMMCEKSVLSYENGIMVLSAQSEDNSFNANSAFLYGKRINDFKSVNFEQLTSLNTSALKAVIQENKDLKAELAAIKEFIGM
jgi:cytoskeletal protein CcmA (bactofilin family)